MLNKSGRKNYYLLKEVAIQSQIISQLTNLVTTLSYSTKPNRARTCEFGHSFCNINHARYNIIRKNPIISSQCSVDEYWWDNLDCRGLSFFSLLPSKSESLFTPHPPKYVKNQHSDSRSTSVDTDKAFQKKLIRMADKLQCHYGIPSRLQIDKFSSFIH